MPSAPETSRVLGTNSKVASASTKRRMAQAVAMRSTWIRSRVMKCMVSASSMRVVVGDQGQLGADALAEREAAVDGSRRLLAAWCVEVVARADLAEPALAGHQLLLGPQPQPKVVVRPRVLGSPREEGLGVGA